MNIPKLIFIALLLTCLCVFAVWQTRQYQNQVIIENELLPEDFAKKHGAPPGVAISNMMFGPFRNIMINTLWLRMERLQKEGRFFEMVQLANWILQTQPGNSTVAQYLAWNMAYNITVTQQSFEVRRRWIIKALETLHTAMQYNPNDPILFREMAWIYQHKLGDELDNAGPYYREKMAEENFRIFGNVHSPDWKTLVEAPANWSALYAANPVFEKYCQDKEEELEKIFFETGALPENFAPALSNDEKEKLVTFIRGQVIRKRLLIEPEHAAWVEEKYGKLDWLLPDVFAIYWSSLGLKKTPDDQALLCQRILAQGLKMTMISGRVIYADGKPGQEFIRIPNFNVTDAACTEVLKVAELIEGHVQDSGYYYFLADVVELLYLYGRKEEAEKYYKILQKEVPSLTKDMNLQNFVFAQIREYMNTVKNDQLQSMISAFILQSIFAFANDADEDAQEMLQTAEMLYNMYRKIHNSEEEQLRLKLPPFKDFKQNVTEMVLNNYPELSPTVKVKLDLQKNNSKPVEK